MCIIYDDDREDREDQNDDRDDDRDDESDSLSFLVKKGSIGIAGLADENSR